MSYVSRIFLIALMLLGATASANEAHEIRQDHRELRNDKRDREWLRNFIVSYDAARERRDIRALRALDRDLRTYVDQEIAEADYKLRQDRREIRHDVHQAREDRRDLRNDVEDDRMRAAREDHRDLHRDRKELRDDLRDAAVDREMLERNIRVARQLSRLIGRMDYASMNRKRMLMNELLQMAHQQVRDDRRELREDRRELHEDRHEQHGHR